MTDMWMYPAKLISDQQNFPADPEAHEQKLKVHVCVPVQFHGWLLCGIAMQIDNWGFAVFGEFRPGFPGKLFFT